MPRSKSHELAWSLGFIQGILSVVRHDRGEMEWFEARGVTRKDIETLSLAATSVSVAFYVSQPDSELKKTLRKETDASNPMGL